MGDSAFSPNDVYEFLTEIRDSLRQKGATDLADYVASATTYFRVPLTSEFYGEAMLALQRVLRNDPATLNQVQRERAALYASEIKRLWFSSPTRTN